MNEMEHYVSKKEFDELKSMVLNLISSINKKDGYDKADKDGIRLTEGNHYQEHSDGISQNSADIDFIAMETGVELED